MHNAHHRSSNLRVTLLASVIFLLSGCAGLIYQVVWTHDLILLFGDTTQGIVTSVSAFLAGLGAGAALAGLIVSRLRRPIILYIFLELGIICCALPMPALFHLIAIVFRHAYLTDSPNIVATIRFILAFTALAPATMLMGATLPVLTRHLVRNQQDIRHWISRLYAVNTLGAAGGTLLSGMVLIELLGLQGTVFVAVGCNLCASIGAIFLARERNIDQQPVRVPVATQTQRDILPVQRLLLGVTFISGFCSLSLEMLWNRSLSLGTGGTIYVFVAILATYLLGVALGSQFLNGWKGPLHLGTLGLSLAIIGPLSLPTLYLANLRGLTQLNIETVLLLFPCAAMGFSFPLTARCFTGEAGNAARGIGLLYASNTLGCVVGTVVSGFFLIPLLGTNVAIIAIAVILSGLGVFLYIHATGPRFRTRFSLSTAVILMALLGLLPVTQRTYVQQVLAAAGAVTHHYEDVVASVDTVSSPNPAKRRLLINGVGITALTVDTKLLVYVPYAERPQSKSILVICFGMGTSYRTAILLGLKTDAVELDPTVPKVMPVYYQDAERFLHNPLGHIYINDGLNYLEDTSRSYNIIVTDAPPPFNSAGAAELLTRGYYRYARSRLTPGGVMSIFIPYTDPCDLRIELRTFQSVFPYTQVFQSVGGYGLQLVGSTKPLDLNQNTVTKLFSRPVVQNDLALAPDNPHASGATWYPILRAHLWLANAQLSSYLGPGLLNTENRPLSEYYLLHTLASSCQMKQGLNHRSTNPLKSVPPPFPPASSTA
ncbi:MAG: fused MFS/spermidine synthase [Candidatus Dormibacteria bacterium]